MKTQHVNFIINITSVILMNVIISCHGSTDDTLIALDQLMGLLDPYPRSDGRNHSKRQYPGYPPDPSYCPVHCGYPQPPPVPQPCPGPPPPCPACPAAPMNCPPPPMPPLNCPQGMPGPPGRPGVPGRDCLNQPQPSDDCDYGGLLNQIITVIGSGDGGCPGSCYQGSGGDPDLGCDLTYLQGKMSLINNRLELVPAIETKIEALVATAMQLRWKLKAVYETAGPPGDPGAPGVEGDQGDSGPAGEPGNCPDQGCLVGPPGPAGPQGDKGSEGTKGECCYGRRGRRGDRGDRGEATKGAQGEQGEKGQPGAPGRMVIDMNVGLTSGGRGNPIVG